MPRRTIKDGTIEGSNMTEPRYHLARVRLLSEERTRELSSILHGREAEVSGDDNLFFWGAEISNTLVDSHYTHMSESTLRNYTADAERGVAFLRGHDWRSLPLGYSISGLLEDTGNRKRVLASFYTVRGLDDTDDLIKRMEAKILRDVSVGYHGGKTTCDICGRDIWDWDCRHIPGLMYEEDKNGVKTDVLSTFTIDDARLSEVSGVFDGSTPEAMIRKIRGLAEESEFTPKQVQLIESRYRIALPSKRSFAVAKEDKEMDETVVRNLLGIGEEEDVLGALEARVKEIESLRAKVKELTPKAEIGETYRKDLIENALSEGVRAQGNSFNMELYKRTLESAPIEVIKQMSEDWKRIADSTLPDGRTSQDEGSKPVESTSFVSDESYRS